MISELQYLSEINHSIFYTYKYFQLAYQILFLPDSKVSDGPYNTIAVYKT